MLLAIVADMDTPQTADEQSEKSMGRGPRDAAESQAELHGASRESGGFSIEEEISEFRALRAAVLRLWNECSPTALQGGADELMRFNEAVDQALAESVTRYVADKERSAHRLEDELRRASIFSDTIIESAPGAFFVIDEHAKLVRWNRYLPKKTGLTDEQLRGNSILATIHEQDRPLAAAKFLAAFATGYAQMEVRIPTPDHGVTYCLETARRFEVGGVPYAAGFCVDVTERKQAEEALTNEIAFFDAMVESVPGAFYVVDGEGNYCRWNSYLNRLTGLSDEELQHRTSLLTIQEEDRPLAAATMRDAFENGYAQCDLHVITRDRGIRVFFMSARRFQVGDATYLVGVGLDTTDRRARMEALEQEAYTDPLTRVANRSRFLDIANQELARCRRYGHPLSLWMLDVDHFKDVNDTYGHKAGDIALQSLVATSRQALRDWDIMARMGGEEFAVLLPETDATQALQVAERFRQSVAATDIPVAEGQVVHLTVSTGITTSLDDDATVDALVDRADKALYEAKKTGRDRVCVADRR
jgi:diguanylate cyclase (GGDEF)-like protein/PAS domain S-box-containing protein